MTASVAVAVRVVLVTAICLGLTLLTDDLEDASRRFGLVAAVLTVVACAPIALPRGESGRDRLGAVVALTATAVGSALGYTMAVPIFVSLALVGLATSRAEERLTGTLGLYAGICMAVTIVARNEANEPLALVGGFAVGMVPALIGETIRTERARTRDARELARRVEQLRDRDVQNAVAEERLRIARDMHDITGHHLSAISLQAAGAGATAADVESRAEFEQIQQLARAALRQTRLALGMLRQEPDPLAPTPRLADLERLLEPARRAGIDATLQVDGNADELPETIELCAYRIVQESLTNVMRHAGADSARIVLDADRDALTIAVDDDGVGLAGESDRAGSGIEGMRERVGLVGGTFAAGPRADGGWSVRATLPLAGVRA